jgi:cystathionine beta-lyase
MKNTFNLNISREKSGSLKWDAVGQIFGAADILPMWVADMDFEIAQPITDAIVQRANHAMQQHKILDCWRSKMRASS